MQNIKIKGMKTSPNFDRKIRLTNGSIIIQKENDIVIGVYMVISFRDNKNRYSGDSTTGYCTLINLDTGKIAFEERCSRCTTERRVLRHLTFAKTTTFGGYPHKQRITYDDSKFRHMRLDIYNQGNYMFNLELGESSRELNDEIYDENDEIITDDGIDLT